MGKKDESNAPGELIAVPHAHDVLCGRGGLTNQHAGNEWYRRLVRSNRALYRSCPKHTKLLVSKAIVQAVQQQDPPGRFLEIHRPAGKSTGTNTGNRQPHMWKEITYKRSVDKTSQALREREPPNANGTSNSNAQASKNQQLQQQEQYLSDLTKITLEAAGLSTPASSKPTMKKPPAENTPEGILTEGTSDDSVDGSKNQPFSMTMTINTPDQLNEPKKRKANEFIKPSWWNRGAPPKKSRWEQANGVSTPEATAEPQTEMNPLPLPPQPLQARQSSMFRFLSQTGIFSGGGSSNAARKPAPAPAPVPARPIMQSSMRASKSSLLDDDDDETAAVANLMKMKAPPHAAAPSHLSIRDMANKAYQTQRRPAALPSALKPAAMMAIAGGNSMPQSFLSPGTNPTVNGPVASGSSTQNDNSMYFGNRNGSVNQQSNLKLDPSASNDIATNAALAAAFDTQQQEQKQPQRSSMMMGSGVSNGNSAMGLPADTSSLSPQEQIELLQKQIELQQKQLQKQHMQQLEAAQRRSTLGRNQLYQQVQQQHQEAQKFQASDESDNANVPAPPSASRLTSQVSDWLTTFWPLGQQGQQKDQAKTGNDHVSFEPRPLPPSQNRNTPAAGPASDDAEIPPALEAGVSSSIFKLVSSPSAMLSSLKSGVSSYFDFSSGRASFLGPNPTPSDQQQQQQQRPSLSVVMGTTAKQSSSLLDDYEETPMESRLRSISNP